MRKTAFVALLASAFAVPLAMQFGTAVADREINCRTVCVCQNRQTARILRVGATCERAQGRAADAAAAAAVCNPGETPCGPVTVFVSHMCFPHPTSGQITAEAFAEYKCERCFEICDFEPCIPDVP